MRGNNAGGARETHSMHVRNTLLAMTFLTAAASAIGCSDANVNGNRGGQVRVVLSGSGAAAAQTDTSATVDHDGDRRIKGIDIVVSDLEARSATEQRLENVSIDLPRTVDLLALMENGGEVDLGVGSLPPGTYDQLVIVVSSMTLTAADDTEIRITPPGGGWTRIVRVDPFEVVDGETTTIRILIRPRLFFGMDDDIHDVGDDDFDPNFEVEIDD